MFIESWVSSATGWIRLNGAHFTGGKESICSEPVRNVGTSGAVFATTEGTRRKFGVGRIRGESEESTPLYGLYRYVRLQSMVMVLIFSCLGHKKGINFV